MWPKFAILKNQCTIKKALFFKESQMETSDIGWSFFLLCVIGWYGTYALISLAFTCFLRRFMVIPLLAEVQTSSSRTIWKESAIWGFWVFWQYLMSIVLLCAYKVIFFVIRKLTRYECSTSVIWNQKERAFLSSNAKSLLTNWVNSHFAKYYCREQ